MMMDIIHSNLYYKIALSQSHTAAMPLVDHGEQQPQSHDGGVRETRSSGCLHSELTGGQIYHCRIHVRRCLQ